MTSATQARHYRQFAKGAIARLAGKTRGRDREVRRNSYDVDDERAKVFRPIGDGSIGQGLAYREALIQAARELRIEEWRAKRPERLQRTDIDVLIALLAKLDFKSGALFPALETIAAAAGCAKNSVVAGLRRLKARGFLDWVRRSEPTGNEGEFGPQRKQTSNAYFFDWGRAMDKRVWARFWQLVVAKLKRLGTLTPPAPLPRPEPPSVRDPGLRAALARLDAALPPEPGNAS